MLQGPKATFIILCMGDPLYDPWPQLGKEGMDQSASSIKTGKTLLENTSVYFGVIYVEKL